MLKQNGVEAYRPINQISPASQSAIELVAHTKANLDGLVTQSQQVCHRLTDGRLNLEENLIERMPKLSELPGTQVKLDAFTTELSPNQKYFADVEESRERKINLYETHEWKKIASAPCEEGQFVFLPDSNHLTVFDSTKLKVFSIEKESFVGEAEFGAFTKLGKVYVGEEPVTDEAELKKLPSAPVRSSFTRFVELAGISSIMAETEIKPRTNGWFILGSVKCWFLVDFGSWNFSSPLQDQCYWMRPREVDTHIKSDEWIAMDPFRFICKMKGKFKATLQFNTSFLNFLRKSLSGMKDIASPANKSMLNLEIEIEVQTPKFPENFISMDTSGCSSYASEVYMFNSQDHKIVVFNTNSSTFENFPIDSDHSASYKCLLGGKYILVGSQIWRKAWLYIKSGNKYVKIFTLDDLNSDIPAFYLEEASQLVFYNKDSSKLTRLDLELVGANSLEQLTAKSFRESRLSMHHVMSFPGSRFLEFPALKMVVYFDSAAVWISKEGSSLELVDMKRQIPGDQHNNNGQNSEEEIQIEQLTVVQVAQASNNQDLWLKVEGSVSQKLYLYSLELSTLKLTDHSQKLGEYSSILSVSRSHCYIRPVTAATTDKEELTVVELTDFSRSNIPSNQSDTVEENWHGNFLVRVTKDEGQPNNKVSLISRTGSLLIEQEFPKSYELGIEELHESGGCILKLPKTIVFATETGVSSYPIVNPKLESGRYSVCLTPDGAHFLLHSHKAKIIAVVRKSDHSTQLVLEDRHADIFSTEIDRLSAFDPACKFAVVVSGQSQQTWELISLEKYQIIASGQVPATLRVCKVWFDQGNNNIKLACVSSSEAVKQGSHLGWISLFSIPFGAKQKCQWNITRQGVDRIERALVDKTQQVEAKEGLIAFWSTLPPQVHVVSPVSVWVLYATSDPELFKDYTTQVLDSPRLFYFHHLLERFLESGQQDWMSLVLSKVTEYTENNVIHSCMEKTIHGIVLNHTDKLSASSMTRDMAKVLLLKKSKTVITGELANPTISMNSILSNSRQEQIVPSEKLAEELLEKNPDTFQEYLMYETTVRLDLTNGSAFSCALFQLVGSLADQELKTLYKPVIYHKWNLLFYYCLSYALLFWLNNTLAYIYLGFLYNADWMGIVIIIICGLLIGFETKTLLGNPGLYSSSWWNYYDICIQVFLIVSVCVNFNSPADDRATMRANVWLRFLPVILLGVRSITWLRVFAPTRYMVTMVLEVFAEFAPFLIILGGVLLMYAYAWRLADGLRLGTQEPEMEFYDSLFQAVNLIFGNAPEPVDDNGNKYDVLKFIIYLVGNVVLALVLLNFLIALISGTSERVSSNRDLFDVKELIPLIQDFDWFLKWGASPLPSEVDEVSGVRSRFVLLVEPYCASDDTKELMSALQAAFASTTTSISSSMRSLELKLDQRVSELDAKFAQMAGDLQSKLVILQSEQANTQHLLKEILSKLK